ncbi:MAG: hypothetical protein ACYC7D_01455 [Nitrososphaerales archaeon]
MVTFIWMFPLIVIVDWFIGVRVLGGSVELVRFVPEVLVHTEVVVATDEWLAFTITKEDVLVVDEEELVGPTNERSARWE